MVKEMLIPYTMYNGESTVQIPISYELLKEGDIYTICCTIDQKTEYKIPMWLRPFKFEIKFSYTNNVCETLYSDYENVANLDSSLFIDKVNKDIVASESEFKVKTKGKALAN
ncbi:MAG TPA: hypothetical protein VIN07_07575 [Flavipsychrobacter sp.]